MTLIKAAVARRDSSTADCQYVTSELYGSVVEQCTKTLANKKWELNEQISKLQPLLGDSRYFVLVFLAH